MNPLLMRRFISTCDAECGVVQPNSYRPFAMIALSSEVAYWLRVIQPK
jgi:hypothetical protein